MPLEGIIDLEAERQRLEKKRAELSKGLEGIDKKLSNENFVKRAPQDVVVGEKERRERLTQDLGIVERNLAALSEEIPFLGEYSGEEQEKVAIRTKYRGYLDREKGRIRRFRGMEKRGIPDELDYRALRGLSNEGREKLARTRPGTVGQASRISGVSPADVSVLLVALRRMAG